MNYRQLKGTQHSISEVGFGVWTIGTTMWGVAGDDYTTGIGLLQRALELGINFFDTADVYGDGKGETLLAQAFAGRRDEIVIATKFGYDFYQHPGVQPGQRERPHNWTPAYIRSACERSLQRLQTDRIDLFQLHNPRLDAIRNDELFETLDALRDEGKILSYGTALGPALDARQTDEGIASINERAASPQIIYNLLEQILGAAILPVARAHGEVNVFVRVPHCSGLLEGSFNESTTFGPNDHRSFRLTSDARRNAWLLDGLQKVKQLAFLTDDGRRTLGQAALQFILADAAIGSVLPNIYNAAQLEEFAATSDCSPLSQDELAAIAILYADDFGLASRPPEPATAG
ncbi:MAG: aldo/keto reductase [Verrucomicrobia bacterium]|nr:MAG: aldo/keto reductase [Verrucomicrobiota bacterium]